jgi:pimeloyl-ACP methyl ester carboxylesterase
MGNPRRKSRLKNLWYNKRMKRNRLLRAAIVVAIACAALALPYPILNPEKLPLDAAARSRAPGRVADLPDGSVHYELTGPLGGRGVVLIHGFSVPSFIWDGTFEALGRAGFRVLRYDLYGRGYSDRPEVSYDADLFVRQLAGLLGAAGMNEPVSLVGISMGASVATAFAAAHPDKTAKVVLMDPAPASKPPLAAKILGLPLLGDYVIGAFGSLILPAGQASDFLDPSKMPLAYLQRYRDQMRYRGFSRAIASSMRHIYDRGYMERYADLEASGRPILLIWGRQDRTAPFVDSQALLKLMRSAEFRPIEGSGHLPHIERPETVIPILVEFLGR